MLDEDHSLMTDFPEFQAEIRLLLETDKAFADENQRYNKLDKEIRELELRDAPIGDAAMHGLKHDRSVLKDSLYQRLVKERASKEG